MLGLALAQPIDTGASAVPSSFADYVYSLYPNGEGVRVFPGEAARILKSGKQAFFVTEARHWNEALHANLRVAGMMIEVTAIIPTSQVGNILGLSGLPRSIYSTNYDQYYTKARKP